MPILHTGIVANNKERIGTALGRFISNNFLTAVVLSERLARIDVVGSLAHWMGEPTNAARLAHYVALALPRIIRSLPRPQIGEFLGEAARQGIEAVQAAPFASRLLAVVWAQGEAQALLAHAIEQGEATLACRRTSIARNISEQSSRWNPTAHMIISEKFPRYQPRAVGFGCFRYSGGGSAGRHGNRNKFRRHPTAA
jgi:uncharacterized membrane-anchored protein YjiN (DUF445 family)